MAANDFQDSVQTNVPATIKLHIQMVHGILVHKNAQQI